MATQALLVRRGGSGGVSVDIITQATAPTGTVKEGRIVIVTSTPSSDIRVSDTLPADLVSTDRTIHILEDATSSFMFTVGEDKKVVVKIGQVRQWNGNSWDFLSGYIGATTWQQFSKDYVRYGFRIKKSEGVPATSVEYILDAIGKTPVGMNYTDGVFDYGGWANAWFIAQNKPAMLKYDGTVDYYLDPNDYSKKEDGITASDVANLAFGGNAMSEIPTVYWYAYEDTSYYYCIFCNGEYDSNYHAYAHMNPSGNVKLNIYLRMFEAYTHFGKMRSISGYKPTTNTTNGAPAERTLLQANGSGWDMEQFSEMFLIWGLCTLISKTLDSQTAFGQGHTGSGSSAADLLTNGSLNAKGQFFGYNTTDKAVKVFHLENWWGDMWERMLGYLNVNGAIKIQPYGTFDFVGTGYISTGVTMSGTSGGYISAAKMMQYGLIASVISGSATTYFCDGGWFNNSQVDVAIRGGDCPTGSACGSSCASLYYLASFAYWSIGSGLSYKSPN